MENKYTVLYVDDEETNLSIFRNTFRREYNVLTAKSAQEGLEILQEEKVDLILTDQRMPDMDGVSFLKHTIDKFPQLNRILITGYTDFDALKTAINDAKIFQYIQKPWREEQLRNIIDKALEVYTLRKENETLNEQLIQKNEELVKLNRELLEIDKLKTDFLSIISHEIRTPLNGIMGSVDLLKQDIGEQEASPLSSLIYILETSVNRLEKFLLAAERITQLKSKSYPIAKESITPSNLINESYLSNKEKIAQKRIIFSKHIECDSTFMADKKLVEFCIDELIDNALKYSSEGANIHIRTERNDNYLVINVIDEGKGFSEKLLNNAFQLFMSDSKNDQQKGLSLALIKTIMDNHKGNVEIKNNTEGGATVSLYFVL
ncbi:MAG TPA: response regulator [Tenuifilaceae bacterium]|nr:response regulator [Tenuifilaceae bacterium]HPE18389.1 response regulator [Tenuifilaceae bacterium]HPJ45906.1 response regulator [Tenuifilaceae bacterium]HPQ34521.1 response regulator [Tenuifilaceae bacterium]HRX68257.1 response regulator [Tenuifilaceae bacterium]